MKPAASLSIDLDNAWAYLRAAGREDWAQSASYLPTVIPHIIGLLRPLELPLTIFVVGRDFESELDVAAIKQFRELKNIEFANHSYNHEPWLHTYAISELESELKQTELSIEKHLGVKPVGFRGPGFSGSAPLWELLAQRDYQYDSSVFPTSLAPIARMYFLLKTGRQSDPRLKDLYGGWRAVLQPNRPFLKTFGTQQLMEYPVTVMPVIRTPIHFSYLMFLAQLNLPLARLYWQMTLLTCRLFRVAPHLLLHPPDFLGGDEEPRLGHMPGMKLQGTRKREILSQFLLEFSQQFEVTTLIDQCRRLALPNSSNSLAVISNAESQS